MTDDDKQATILSEFSDLRMVRQSPQFRLQ